MPKALTDSLVRNAQPPERGQLTITDSTLRNFALRLSQGGSKTFVVTLGRGKRHTIGQLSYYHSRRSPQRGETHTG